MYKVLVGMGVALMLLLMFVLFMIPMGVGDMMIIMGAIGASLVLQYLGLSWVKDEKPEGALTMADILEKHPEYSVPRKSHRLEYARI